MDGLIQIQVFAPDGRHLASVDRFFANGYVELELFSGKELNSKGEASSWGRMERYYKKESEILLESAAEIHVSVASDKTAKMLNKFYMIHADPAIEPIKTGDVVTFRINQDGRDTKEYLPHQQELLDGKYADSAKRGSEYDYDGAPFTAEAVNVFKNPRERVVELRPHATEGKGGEAVQKDAETQRPLARTEAEGCGIYLKISSTTGTTSIMWKMKELIMKSWNDVPLTPAGPDDPIFKEGVTIYTPRQVAAQTDSQGITSTTRTASRRGLLVRLGMAIRRKHHSEELAQWLLPASNQLLKERGEKPITTEEALALVKSPGFQLED